MMINWQWLATGALALLSTTTCYVAAVSGEDSSRTINLAAVSMFLVFIVATLGISYWASKRTASSAQFYNAGGQISGLQNGAAIAGDFMSAASFLGISGLIFAVGFDGLILAIGALSGWPIMLFLLSERVRNVGRFTFTDVVSYRLQKNPIRAVGTLGSLSVTIFYLIAQMVGGGKIIELLFGVPYWIAVCLVGVLSVIYVFAGGMLATTWVQIVKAILVLFGVTVMVLLILVGVQFDFGSLLDGAVSLHPRGIKILQPGSFFGDPVQAITIGVSMMFGVLGLPHVLMRLFTVADMRAARKSVFFASTFMGYFYLATIVIGFAAILYLAQSEEYLIDGKLIGGNNMAAIHLAHAVGGDFLMGFMSAVAFATILAVVAGLTVAGTAAISHDVYAEMVCNGEPDSDTEWWLTRVSSILICSLAVLLGILFEHQNVAFIAVMALVVAASVNFPILILAIYWRNLTTRGAIAGGLVGFFSSMILIVLGPKVWVSIVGADVAVFPYDYPALFTMPAAFATIYIVSMLDSSDAGTQDRQYFDRQLVAAELATNKR